MGNVRKGQIKVLAYADSALYSGAEAVFCDTVRGLCESGRFDVVAVAPLSNEKLSRELELAAGRDLCRDVPAQPSTLAAFHLYDPRRMRTVRNALGDLEVDVMLVNLPSAEYGPSPMVAEALSGTPSVGLIHISGRMDDLEFRFGRLRRWLARRAIAKLDAIAFLSKNAAEEFQSRWDNPGPESRLFRPTEPTLSRIDRKVARAAFDLPQTVPVIGMIGRLTMKQKGQDVLVEAARILVRDNPSLRFVVAGQGRDKHALIELIEKAGLAGRFDLIGQVDDVSAFMSAIDLIAVPSRFEGLPLVVLEALKAGRPGTASAVDGIKDVWPEEWMVSAGDPVALARSLGSLLESDEKTTGALIDHGRRRAKAATTQSTADDVAAILEEFAHG